MLVAFNGAVRGRSPREVASRPITMPPLTPDDPDAEAAPPPDYYVEAGLLVYTATFHLRRGHCCGSGCRHCPYEPRHIEGNRTVRE